MNPKLRVGVVFGGKSVEHEVSLISAKSVIESMDKERFDVIPIGVTKEGGWLAPSDSMKLLHGETVDHEDLNLFIVGSKKFKGLIKVQDPGLMEMALKDQENDSGYSKSSGAISSLDVIFPLIHGSYGEDGKLQGMLEMANIPYVGAGPLSSALGIDKDMMKRLFKLDEIPTADYIVIFRSQMEKEKELLADSILKKFDLPVFVKPAHAGSSVGISKAKTIESLKQAIQEAFRYDEKILIERALNAREIECSVLGNEEPIASVPGEIVPCNEFYDYKAKYIEEGSQLIIPADLPEERVKEIQQLSIKAFETLECCGMARVDLFLERETNKIYLNELNTIPGFTPISMYPKLLEYSGIPFTELITRLIQLALEKHEQRSRLVTSYEVGVE